jgi:hypothetical protein
MRRARASGSRSRIGSHGSPASSAWWRRICSINRSSTSEITDEMPYFATWRGLSMVKPVPMTGM